MAVWSAKAPSRTGQRDRRRRRGHRWRAAAVVLTLGVGFCGPAPTTQPAVDGGGNPPAAVEPAKPPETEVADPELARLPGRVHTVQAGDTLYSIAVKYYGDGKQWRRIYVANRNRLGTPEDLRAGMKLIVP